MSTASRKLEVRFGGTVDPSLPASAGKASKQIDRVGNSADDAGRKSKGGFGAIGAGLRGIAGPLAAAGAALGGASLFSDAIGGASDLVEVGTKMDQIFGKDGADAVRKFANQGAKALGQTSLDVQNAAATFGVFGKSAGLGGQKLAGFSNQFVQLSTDLASFHNADPSEVVEALGAALRGEAEPMRRFGVLLDDASMRQEAMRMGLIKTTKEALTPQQKVLSAQSLIMKQTKDAQGDFARTSGGLANQQRILSASWEEAKAKLGTGLLPTVNRGVTLLNDNFAPAMERAEAVGHGLVGVWDLLTKGDFKSGMFGLEEDSPAVNVLFTMRENAQALGDMLKDNVLPAVQGLGDRFESWRGKVLPIVTEISTAVSEKWAQWGPTIGGYVNQVTQIIGEGMTLVGQIIGGAVTAITWAWSMWGDDIMRIGGIVFDTIARVIGGALDVIQGIIRTWSAVFRGDWSGALDGIKQTWSGAWQIVSSIFMGWVRIIGVALTEFKDKAVTAFRFLKDGAVTAMGALRDLATAKADQAKEWVLGKFTSLRDRTVTLFSGIGGTIAAGFSGITGALAAPLRTAADWLNRNVLSPMNAVSSKFGVSIPQLPKFHQGGVIPGWQEMPIMALGGEGVLNPRAMRNIGGKKTLDALNNGHTGGPGFDWIKKPGQWLLDAGKNGLAWALGKLFDTAGSVGSSFPPAMAGQLLGGTVDMMRSAALAWAKGKDAVEQAIGSTTATLPGGRAWPANTRRLSGNYAGHSGVDIAAAMGTPIFAAASGPITYAGWGRGYGQAIFQAVGAGLQAVYGHSSKVNVRAGQQVSAGQQIGNVGSTGRSSGPHLHFEVDGAGGFGSAANRGYTLKWLGYDQGGILPPGLSATYNATGKPEPVLTNEQWERLLGALEGMAKGDRSTVVDGRSLRAAIRSESLSAVRAESRREGVLA